MLSVLSVFSVAASVVVSEVGKVVAGSVDVAGAVVSVSVTDRVVSVFVLLLVLSLVRLFVTRL